MKVLITAPVDYTLSDLYSIKRWMCPRCGLIFDYQFEMGEVGWPEFAPSLLEADIWTDEICPRCRTNFSQEPLLAVIASKFEIGSLSKPTFVVEDEAHERVVRQLAEQLNKDVVTFQAGSSSQVKNHFKQVKSQGNLANGYFMVDGDNQGPDSTLSKEPHFIQLDKYCIENYFLNFDVCAAISNRTRDGIRASILTIIQKKFSRSQTNEGLFAFLVATLQIDDITEESLAVFDGSKILTELPRVLGFKEEKYINAYIAHCISSSTLNGVLPSRLVDVIQNLPVKVNEST